MARPHVLWDSPTSESARGLEATRRKQNPAAARYIPHAAVPYSIMTRRSLSHRFAVASAALVLTGSAALAQLTPAQRLAKWKPVEMQYHTESLSAKERAMVEKLVDASRLLDQVYWHQ